MSAPEPFKLPSLVRSFETLAELHLDPWLNGLSQAMQTTWLGLARIRQSQMAPAVDVFTEGLPPMHCGEPSMVTLLQAATVCWQTAPADLSQLQGFARSSSTQHFIWCRLDPSLAPNWVAVAVLSADPSDALTALTTTATPWLEALGRAIHWHESWRIERELHRQALARMDWIEQALCFAREVVWELDCTTMRIRYSRYIAALDRPAADPLPLSLDDFLHSVHHEDRPTVRQRLQQYLDDSEQECYFEYRQLHRDGHWIWSRSRGRTAQRDAQGRPLRLLGTAVGISLQKNLEHSLRESERRLQASEGQLRQRERELTAALDRAEQAARERTQFLATMSHEIRTPLNSIIGASRLAMLESDPRSMSEHLSLINHACGLLMGLVNSVLDHSRLQSGVVKLELAPVVLPDLLRGLIRQFAQTAKDRQLQLALDLDPAMPSLVQADALRLTQILNNLLANALRFTHRGEVTLQTEVLGTTQHDCRLRLSVRDSGIGMTPQQSERLFRAYAQADESIARRYGGTGLGLSISHRLVELMGGRFSVQSQPGVGSTFAFDLVLPVLPIHPDTDPLDRNELSQRLSPGVDALAHRIESAGHGLRGHRVLVVDDNPMNIVVIRKFLERAGLEVHTCGSASHALDLLQTESFSAVLMDLYMPEMSGAEATQRLRRDPRHERLPILAVSASVTPEEREFCRAAGMNDFISKPLDPEQLFSSLLQWIVGPAKSRAVASDRHKDQDPGLAADHEHLG